MGGTGTGKHGPPFERAYGGWGKELRLRFPSGRRRRGGKSSGLGRGKTREGVSSHGGEKGLIGEGGEKKQRALTLIFPTSVFVAKKWSLVDGGRNP